MSNYKYEYEDQIEKLMRKLSRKNGSKEITIIGHPETRYNFYTKFPELEPPKSNGSNSPKFIQYEIKCGNKIVAEFKIKGFPSCCGLYILTNFNIREKHRTRKEIKLIRSIVFNLCKYLNIQNLVFTTISGSRVENLALQAKAKPLSYIDNSKTTNDLTIWLKEFRPHIGTKVYAPLRRIANFFKKIYFTITFQNV